MSFRTTLTALLLSALALPALANEAAIRKSFAELMPNVPAIDEVTATPVPGLFEVRIGHDIVYTDAQGSFLIRGELIDLMARRNLTEERVNKLTAIDFASLPLRDAIVMKNGNGKRKIAVFADPNCG